MVLSVICVLILLASFISVTGRASAILPSQEGILNMLNNIVILEGNDVSKCNIDCARESKTCILATQEGKLKRCIDKVKNNYQCYCADSNNINNNVPVYSQTDFDTLQPESSAASGNVSEEPQGVTCNPLNPCEETMFCNEESLCENKKQTGDECADNLECVSDSCLSSLCE